MTIADFSEYIAARSVARIIYSVDNNVPMNGIGLRLYFDRVIACPEIGELCLFAGNGRMRPRRNSLMLYGVTGIELIDHGYYDATKITCQTDGETYQHTLVIDYK